MSLCIRKLRVVARRNTYKRLFFDTFLLKIFEKIFEIIICQTCHAEDVKFPNIARLNERVAQFAVVDRFWIVINTAIQLRRMIF